MMQNLKNNFPENNSYWLQTSLKKDDRPINSISADLESWKSTFGWKEMLEKLHASAEDDWLVPSSQNFKMKTK